MIKDLRKSSVRKKKKSDDASLQSQTKPMHLSNLAHEFRTSIMGIVGYTEMLIEDMGNNEFEDLLYYLSEIHLEGTKLLNVINDIFDTKKIDAQTLSDMDTLSEEIKTAALSLVTFIKNNADILLIKMEKRHLNKFIPDVKMVLYSAERFLSSMNHVSHACLSGTDRLSSNLNHQDIHEIKQDLVTPICNISEEPPIQKGALKGKILIVDDSEQNCRLLARRLTRDGHIISTAATGREALIMLACNMFDLVLLDIIMPEINGYQVLQRMKSDDKLSHIPVIMLSALEEINHVVRCIEMGAEDYLHKPFDPVLLRARIGACLEKKHLRDCEQDYLIQLRAEREKSEQLLLNILPAPIVERLKKGESPIADSYKEATVMFADLVGFTQLSTKIVATKLIGYLNEIFTMFDEFAQEYGLEKIKTSGDSYMVVGGVPIYRPDHAEAVASMSLNMLEGMVKFNAKQNAQTVSLRIGIHTGPVIAGVIGTKKFIYDIWGDTVNIASRMESHGLPNHIQLTETTQTLLSEKFKFEKRGLVDLKGRGKMVTYFLKGKI